MFVIGLLGLWKGTSRHDTGELELDYNGAVSTLGSRSIYVLLLVYAASTTTTTLPCLSVILSTPISATPLRMAEVASTTAKTVALTLTAEQRLLLLSSYIPFFLVPLVMTVDMASRVQSLVSASTVPPKTVKQD